MILAMLAALAIQPAPAATIAPPPSLQTTPDAWSVLQADLTRIAAAHPGQAGFAVVDLTTGRSVGVNLGQRFPMASTVKLAIAACFLSEVDAGRRSLTTPIAIDDRLRLRADGITFFAPFAGVSLSGANLIDLMLTRSDNTATDVLLAELGGPAAVQAWLTRNRVTGLRIDRSIAQLLLDRRGGRVQPGQTPAEAMRRWDPVAPGSTVVADPETDAVPNPSFDADPRDTATPMGFAEFMARIDRGEMLRPVSRAFLYQVMARTLTGSNRIKGALPAGTPVLHKTGTLAGVSNDVGIVTLPDGRRLIVAAFVRGGSGRPTVIAKTARAAFDRLSSAR